MNLLHHCTSLYKTFKTAQIEISVNSDLERLKEWLSVNKLFLNINKTSYMVFSVTNNATDLNLKIGNSILERSRVQKFLGVLIDQQLTFKEHINKTAAKISRGVGMMRRLKPFVPEKVLISLHYAFVHSITSYAITTYGSATQFSLSRIVKLVNSSLKIATRQRRITQETCKELKIFYFDLSLKYFTCIKMFQILKTSSHAYFKEKFDANQTRHIYNTRASSAEHLSIPRARINRCQKSFLINGVKCWNTLPVFIRNSDSMKIFKTKLRNFMFLL